jgi:molecular chaperone GrpE (heat shock protein)
MSKKLVIFGLVLLFVGGGAVGWVITEERKEKQQQRERQERFKTSLSKLDKIVGDELDARDFDDIILDENHQQDSGRYEGREETREFVLTISGMLMVTGGVMLGWWLLWGMIRLFIKVFSRLVEFFVGVFRGRAGGKAKKPAKAEAEAAAKVRAKAETERKARADTEAEKLAEARRKAKVRAAERARAGARAKAKARRKAKVKAEKKAGAESEAKAKAEMKAKAKAEKKATAEARAKAKAEKRLNAEAERRAEAEEKARAEAKADERLRAEAEAKAKAKAEKRGGVATSAKEDENLPGREQKRNEQQKQAEKYSRLLSNSGWQNLEAKPVGNDGQAQSQGVISMESEAAVENSGEDIEQDCEVDAAVLGTEQADVLFPDEESVEFEEPSEVKVEGPNLKTGLPNGPEDSVKLEESVKAQTERLEKQVEQFRQIAGASFGDFLQSGQTSRSVQHFAREQSKPVEASLRELTQQVSAIREYAAHQQERVKKLQDGYDWNIIKNFCLRVIRCIDNLENRIETLSAQDIDTTGLEEIKDELIFALESNGVEQFEPEPNSDYEGQQKKTEAVKDKEGSDDPNLRGKIAKVVRPGYQYFIDEENVKIVRPAQVKLFA